MDQRESEQGEGRKLGEKAVIYLFNYLLPDLKWWYFSKQGVFFLSSLQQNFMVGGTEMFKFNKFGFGLLR